MTCHYPDLDSDGSPVWNFCNHLGGNQWCHGELLAVFLGSHLWNYFIQICSFKGENYWNSGGVVVSGSHCKDD